jgi:DNA-binding FadR family transcriptional regulator
MSEDNFHEVIQHFLIMRSSLEPQACQLAAQSGSAEQKAHLNTLMEEMVYLKKHFNRERWIEVDMAWHEHIYTMSANPFHLFRYAVSFYIPYLLHFHHSGPGYKARSSSGYC